MAVGFDPAVLSVGEAASGTIECSGHDVRVVSFARPVRLGLGAGLVSAIRQIADGADAVLVCSAQLLPAVRAARLDLPVIWDTTELEYLHYRRLPQTLSNRVKGAVWWSLERWSCAYADVVVAISDEEAASWRQIFPSCAKRLCVVDHSPGSAVDAHGEVAAALRGRGAASPPRLVFVGNLTAKQNLEAARWIVRSLAPLMVGKAELVLVGPGTESLEVDPAVQATVTCLGEVECLSSVLTTAAIALAPLMSGAGVKTKVLDYVASGLRVVGTPLAFEGMGSCPGLVCAGLDDFPAAIEGLLARAETDAESIERRELQGRWLRERCHPEVTQAQWLAAFARVGVAPSTTSESERYRSYTDPTVIGSSPASPSSPGSTR